MFDEVIPQEVVEGIHRLQDTVDLCRGVETGNGHIFLGAGTIHTRVLDDGIHLELLGIAAVEETQHIVDGDTTV